YLALDLLAQFRWHAVEALNLGFVWVDLGFHEGADGIDHHSLRICQAKFHAALLRRCCCTYRLFRRGEATEVIECDMKKRQCDVISPGNRYSRIRAWTCRIRSNFVRRYSGIMHMYPARG